MCLAVEADRPGLRREHVELVNERSGFARLLWAGSFVVAECVFNALAVELVAAMDAFGVDAEQDIDAVAGPLGDLGGVDACV